MPNARISMWIMVAFAITGLLIGFMTGASHTPVVRGILPLLFAVIGGGAGFFSVTRVENSRAIGLALSAFALTALVGSLEGIVVRDGITWRELFAGRAQIELPASTQGNAQRYAKVLAIKLRLQRLGASPQEITALAAAAATAKDEDLVQVENTVSSIERGAFPQSPGELSRGFGFAYIDPETIRRKEAEMGLQRQTGPGSQ